MSKITIVQRNCRSIPATAEKPPSDKNISIIQWNCRGITWKSAELAAAINEMKQMPTVIMLQETFLKPSKTFQFRGYDVVRVDHPSGSGSGVATLIRDGTPFREEKLSDDPAILSTTVKFENGESVDFINAYVSPLDNRQETREVLEKALARSGIFLAGDLNAHSSLFGHKSTNCRGRLIEDLMADHNLVTLNDGSSTHKTAGE